MFSTPQHEGNWLRDRNVQFPPPIASFLLCAESPNRALEFPNHGVMHGMKQKAFCQVDYPAASYLENLLSPSTTRLEAHEGSAEGLFFSA